IPLRQSCCILISSSAWAACRRTVVEGAGCGLGLPHRFEFAPAGASDLSPRIRELFQKPALRDGFRLTIYYLRGESRLGVRLLQDNRAAGGASACPIDKSGRRASNTRDNRSARP